jgi:dienelactone hydrolase
MKKIKNFRSLLICLVIFSITSSAHSKNLPPKIKEEMVTYTADGISFKGFVAYDENIKGKRPVIVVVPEWWGMNDYAKMRAGKLAESGYLAIAVDVFGDGKVASNPTEAQTLTTPFYKDPKLAKSRLDAAIKKVKEYQQADQGNIAVIGYCFGGYVALNYAKLGADIKGVVSFHGGMGGLPVNKSTMKAKVLVCHGDADKFVSRHDVDLFKHQLDSIGNDNTFKFYANATHAFTNPDATKTGKQFNMPIEYNAVADRDSWNDMKSFLSRIFKN